MHKPNPIFNITTTCTNEIFGRTFIAQAPGHLLSLEINEIFDRVNNIYKYFAQTQKSIAHSDPSFKISKLGINLYNSGVHETTLSKLLQDKLKVIKYDVAQYLGDEATVMRVGNDVLIEYLGIEYTITPLDTIPCSNDAVTTLAADDISISFTLSTEL